MLQKFSLIDKGNQIENIENFLNFGSINDFPKRIVHSKLKLKFEFIKFKVICILLGKSYTFASNKAIILTSILLLGMISVICLLLCIK